MPTLTEHDAKQCFCAFNSAQLCQASKCMAWVWTGPAVERRRTTNLIDTPEGKRPDETKAPPRPDGEGWEPIGDPRYTGYDNSAKLKLPKALEQEWERATKRTHGRCGRVPGCDNEYPW